MPNPKNPCTMAFDFGLTRIGIALGNSLLKISHPLATITGRNKFDILEQIAILLDKWQPAELVVGIPSNQSDKEQLVRSIKKFANRLKNKFHLPIILVNEDYTSSIASEQLAQQKVTGIKQKNKLDQLAACNILDRYFNEIQEKS